MKEFNTIGVCIPSKHYMVDITDRVKEIKKIVDAGKYFVINRARQYGKTTTLDALEKVLLDDYCVLSLDFQGISGAGFRSEEAFVKAFSRNVIKKAEAAGISSNVVNELKEYITRKEDEAVLDELFSSLNEWCEESSKPIVMIIDEVDSATNNQVFLDFLAQLRLQYLEREKHSDYKTFRSVILAGVTDVKHLKSKIRTEDQHKVNSPFNIAADFNIDMRLPEDGIKEMLDEYNADHHTDMNTGKIAAKIWEYTNGYPYLVSRICQIIDTRLVPDVFSLCEAWTEYGVEEAVKSLLSETDNPLFESLTGKLINYPELKGKLRNILLRGETLAWLPYDEEQKQLFMYGFIQNNHNTVAVFNRIFEMLLYIHFIGESDKNNDLKQMASEIKFAFVDSDGWLDVPKIMDHFIKEHNRIHKECTEKFLEEEGRERFITYVSAIINGTGTYDIEPQTRDHKRMDLVIHYLGRRYIVELKIWRGDRYNEKGEQQIKEYLDYWNLDTGYMLSFNFNQNKEPGVRRVHVGDKVVFEGMV